MAYASSYLNDEEKKKLENQGAGVSTSGVVDSVAGGGTAAGMAEAPAKAPGTGFVNLQQYLDMNKGQGANLANKVTEDVNKSADTYKTAAQTAVDQGKAKFDQSTGADKASTIKTGIVQDADVNRQAAKDFLGSSYGGPSANDFTASLAANKGKLQSDLSKVGDIETQQAGLQKAYGQNGNYTQGYGLLDSFLLQGDESGRQKINEVKGRANEVGTTYDTAASTLANQEKQARDALAANKKSVVDTAVSQKANLENEANRKVQRINLDLAKQDREGKANASLGDVLSDPELADLQALGDIANVDADYMRTLNRGTAKPGYDMGVSNDEGFVFTPTGKRFDADGNEIPPEGGVAKNAALPGGASAPASIPVPTNSTWQAMPAPVLPAPPPLRSSGKTSEKSKKLKAGDK